MTRILYFPANATTTPLPCIPLGSQSLFSLTMCWEQKTQRNHSLTGRWMNCVLQSHGPFSFKYTGLFTQVDPGWSRFCGSGLCGSDLRLLYAHRSQTTSIKQAVCLNWCECVLWKRHVGFYFFKSMFEVWVSVLNVSKTFKTNLKQNHFHCKSVFHSAGDEGLLLKGV